MNNGEKVVDLCKNNKQSIITIKKKIVKYIMLELLFFIVVLKRRVWLTSNSQTLKRISIKKKSLACL